MGRPVCLRAAAGTDEVRGGAKREQSREDHAEMDGMALTAEYTQGDDRHQPQQKGGEGKGERARDSGLPGGIRPGRKTREREPGPARDNHGRKHPGPGAYRGFNHASSWFGVLCSERTRKGFPRVMTVLESGWSAGSSPAFCVQGKRGPRSRRCN